MEEPEAIGIRRGQEVRDADDRRLGKLEEIYFDPRTGRAAFVCVKAGLLGRRLSFVPFAGAAGGEGYLRVEQTRAQVRQAPSLQPDPHLTSVQARRLREHYASARPGGTLGGDASVATLVPAATDRPSGSPGEDLLARLDALERRVAALQRTLG